MRYLYLLAALAGCNAYDKDLGPAPFYCGSNDPRCPMGYTCQKNPGGGSDICYDGSATFNCADDSAHEPNETPAAATLTMIDTSKSIHLDGLAICPAGDKDTYSVSIATAGENLEAIIAYDTGGTSLHASILDGSGTSVADSAAVAGMPGTIRAYAPGLAIGLYYVQVAGPNTDAAALDNYALTINATGP